MSAGNRLAIFALLGMFPSFCPDSPRMFYQNSRPPDRLNRRERIAANYARRACEGLGGIPKGRP